METTRLSAKGQVVIPKAVRDAHGWLPGTEFDIETQGDAIVLRPRRLFKPSKLEDVAGCLRYDGPAKSLEDMDEAITLEAQRRARR
jgi:AbrB family looped-hinge helix DNA binding protein